MAIDQSGSELQALGVSGRDLRCLLLLPQIYVGWASPTRDVAALEALLDTTARHAHFPPSSVSLARGWLFERPTRAQFQSGFALLRVLRAVHERPLIAASDTRQAMFWAVRAAHLMRQKAQRGAGRAQKLAEIRAALLELEAWLELDTRHQWLDLLTEAEALAERARDREPRAERTRDREPRAERARDREPRTDTARDPDADEEVSALRVRPDLQPRAYEPFPLLRRLG